MATIVDFLAIFADLLPLPSTQIAQTSCRSAHLQVRLCTASAVQLSAEASLSRNADAALRDAVDVDGQLNYETHTAMSAQYREKCQHSTGTNLPAVGSLAISYDNIASKFLMAASAADFKATLLRSTCTHKINTHKISTQDQHTAAQTYRVRLGKNLLLVGNVSR